MLKLQANSKRSMDSPSLLLLIVSHFTTVFTLYMYILWVMSDDKLGQSNIQYEIFGGCHDFEWQQIIIFLPSTNLLSIEMDVRVGVKFPE